MATARRPDLALHVYRDLARQRRMHGLPVATPTPLLVQVAHWHNRWMADAGRLSHQLPGETSLAHRLRRVGIRFSWAAENVGTTDDVSVAGAVSIQRMFYNQRPPHDGHRRNVLASQARQVGVDVYERDGRLWLTQIFIRRR